MDQRLKGILGKLLEDNRVESGDRAYLEGLIGSGPERAIADGPRPLWHWIRKQVFLHQDVLNFYFDAELDPILIDAGAPAADLKPNAYESRKLAPVTQAALERSVRRHLANDQTGPRAHATRLVGLAELSELVPVVVDSVASGREERQDWGMPVIAAGLETLALLRHPQARTLAMRYLGHRDHQVKRAAQVAALIGEPPTKEELAKILDAKLEANALTQFTSAFVHGAKIGGFSEAQLEDMLKEAYFGVDGWNAVAEIVLAGGWKGLFGQLLTKEDGNARAAMALSVAWSSHTWAAPLLQARLGEDEDDDEVRMTLVAAVGSLGPEYKSFIKERLGSDQASERTGAVWAALGIRELNGEIEPLLRDPEASVRRAASCALAVNRAKPNHDLIELKWTELLNEDAWWPWAVPLKGLRSVGCPLPRSTRAFLWVSGDQVNWTPAELEEARSLVREVPHQLLRWLTKETPDSQRARAAALAGLIGGDVIKEALEQALLSAEQLNRGAELALELACLGGARTRAAAFKTKLVFDDQPRAEAEDLLAAATFAVSGDSETRRRAARALAGLGEAAEPILSTLITSTEAEVAQAAADAAAQRSGAKDPLLADVARILNSEVRQLSSLESIERLISCRAPRVRTAIAELAARPENPADEVVGYLLELAVDKEEDVAVAALGSLAQSARTEEWAKTLLLQASYSEQWRTKQKAVSTMALIADPIYLPRFLELVKEEDYQLKEHSVQGLERIAQNHPERGLVVLDIREPYRVRERYALSDNINHEADQHSEALRMLLLGLQKRSDAGEAKKSAGRKVMLMPAGSETPLEAAWTQKQFEALALYLKVTYSDEDSGAIVAEISDEPTGEVLSALLQSSAVAATTIGWA